MTGPTNKIQASVTDSPTDASDCNSLGLAAAFFKFFFFF